MFGINGELAAENVRDFSAYPVFNLQTGSS